MFSAYTSVEFSTLPRAWDLKAGDFFRGRTVAAVQGLVGLAHNPLAIIFFSEENAPPIRVPATHADAIQHTDEITLRARIWVRERRLREGDMVDLNILRHEVIHNVA